jgi:hypothetical protein
LEREIWELTKEAALANSHSGRGVPRGSQLAALGIAALICIAVVGVVLATAR